MCLIVGCSFWFMFRAGVVFDVRCLCIYVYIIYYIILLYIILLYIIISYTILFCSIYLPSSSSPFLPSSKQLIHSIRVGTYIRLFIFHSDLSSVLFSSSIPFLLHLSRLSIFCSIPIHSIRVGVYCWILISQTHPDNSTPHVLSEWMVEV